MSGYDLFLVLSFGLLLVVAVVLFLPLRRRPAQSDIPGPRQPTEPIFRDDDSNWYGFFYHNPDDPDPFVPKRYGWGWTLNFAHPSAKVIVGALLAIILLPIVLALFGVLPAGAGCHPTTGCGP